MAADDLVLGRLGAPHGVRGWMKLQSFTEDPDAIFGYGSWKLCRNPGDAEAQQLPFSLVRGMERQRHGRHWLVRLSGIDSPEAASGYTGCSIIVESTELPDLGDDGYYWRQLIGLRVRNLAGEDLGIVHRLFETGANDVLVLDVDKNAVPYSEGRERLVPLVFERVVTRVDEENGLIFVDWGADY